MNAEDRRAPGSDGADFFAALDHPLKPALRAVCSAILGASPAIGEGVKWNAPSYFVGGKAYFATANIHTRGKSPATVLVILHRGAKARAGRVALQDPEGLIEWLGPDRGAVRFTSLAEVRRKAPAFKAIVRQWIMQL
jgi:hypothetical protein